MNIPVPPPLQPGDVVAEQFELLEVVGRGSTATVYRAWDRRRGAAVALKVASYELNRDGSDAAERWQREANLLERLDTPHIVRFYGLYHDQPSRSLTLAMEYVGGESLSTRLARDGALTWRRAVETALAVGRALVYAHQWLVHRDVKPANILLGRGNRVALTDFGIAKDLVSGETGSTIVGTSRYMAPEQRLGAHVDGRTDVFALGLVLAEMVLGKHPWEALLAERPEAVPPSAVDLPYFSAPEAVADQFRAAVNRATRPDPEARYPSMAAFVSDLEAIAALVPQPQPAVASASEQRWRTVRPPWWALALGGMVVLAALGWGLAGFVGSRGPTPLPTSASTATPAALPPVPAVLDIAATTTPGFNAGDFLDQGNAYNCDDFATQAQAQEVLRAAPSDPNRLDGNRDGIACADRPAPKNLTPVARR